MRKKGSHKKIRTTIRQKQAIKLIVESGGKKSVSSAMREAGFSPATAKNPDRLTKSKAWKELMEEFLPQIDLAAAHKKLLNLSVVQHVAFPAVLNDSEIKELVQGQGGTVKKIKRIMGTAHVWYFVPDGYSLKGGLDMAYKLNGAYAPVKVEDVTPYESMTDEEILQELEDIKKFREAQKTLSDSRKREKMKRH